MQNKILIIGPAWVGDMVMAQGLFKLLKKQMPTVSIDVLAPAWSEPLLARMPEVSASMIMPVGHGKLDWRERYRLGKNLRASHYDQAIVLPNSFKSALIPFFAKIPRRTGWRGEMRWGLLNDLRYLNKKSFPLMLQRYLALGLPASEIIREDVGADEWHPELFSSPETQQAVLDKLHLPYPARPLLVLCPGAEFGPAKRWPEDYFAAVANAKLAEGWDVWVLGSPKDAPVTQKIMELTGNHCVNLTGNTSLQDAIDLLALATAVVSNDSGLMHIAASVKKPVVALYGPTTPEHTPPLGERARVLSTHLACQPCQQRECPLTHHLCMRDLTALSVLNALKELV
jgi:heptosyltransferase-2